MSERQAELFLPPRPVDDVLHERLAAAVADLNATGATGGSTKGDTMSDQLSLHLSQPSADEVIREKLEHAVEQFNEAVDPAERTERYLDILRLRSLLKGGGA